MPEKTFVCQEAHEQEKSQAALINLSLLDAIERLQYCVTVPANAGQASINNKQETAYVSSFLDLVYSSDTVGENDELCTTKREHENA